MKLVEDGRVVGEVKHFKERLVEMGGQPQRVCAFEVVGEICGKGPVWLEEGGKHLHIDITSTRSGESVAGRHWRIEADIASPPA